MKIIKSGTINGKQFQGRILNDNVPYMASLVFIEGTEVTEYFQQLFPTFEAAEACIHETWDELVKADGKKLSRIDEIKERLELTNQNKLYHYGDGSVREDMTADFVAEFNEATDAEFYVNAPADMEYLLSLNEGYKNAINVAIKHLESDLDTNALVVLRMAVSESVKGISLNNGSVFRTHKDIT